jgi:hypothetical protein
MISLRRRGAAQGVMVLWGCLFVKEISVFLIRAAQGHDGAKIWGWNIMVFGIHMESFISCGFCQWMICVDNQYATAGRSEDLERGSKRRDNPL